MSGLADFPAILFTGISSLVVVGLILLISGEKLARRGGWLLGMGIVALLGVDALGWVRQVENGHVPETWLRGWIGPREELGSISVGLLSDGLGLTMAALGALISLALLFGIGAEAKRVRPDRFFAALSFGVAGVALSWVSLTPWMALIGVGLTLLGGFLGLGCRWNLAADAELSTRFAWERSWGLILSAIGLGVLAGGRSPLIFGGTASEATAVPELVGAAMLFGGAWIQFQPFPFLGAAITEAGGACPARIVSAQIFPAFASLALLVRWVSQFEAAGVLSWFGWAGLLSAVLAGGAGLIRGQWKLELGAWVSCGFSLAIAALAFSGAPSALLIAIGTGLGASAIAGGGAALEEEGEPDASSNQRALWAKIACGLGAALSTGMLGFVGLAGISRMLGPVLGQPGVVSALVGALFVYSFLGWKVAWCAIQSRELTAAGWAPVLAPYLMIILGLGALWTGTATGDAIPGHPDHLFKSLLSLMFGSENELGVSDALFGTVSAIHWGVWVTAAFGAYMTAGRNPDFWPNVSRSAPGFTRFVSQGYGIDLLFARLSRLVARVGEASSWLLDRKTWGQWIPDALSHGLQRGSAVAAKGDAKFAFWLGGALRQWVDLPGRGLQAIQNGDVQWYLFFAVGSGILVLIHFLRT